MSVGLTGLRKFLHSLTVCLFSSEVILFMDYQYSVIKYLAIGETGRRIIICKLQRFVGPQVVIWLSYFSFVVIARKLSSQPTIYAILGIYLS